jgi:hypothetical protein
MLSPCQIKGIEVVCVWKWKYDIQPSGGASCLKVMMRSEFERHLSVLPPAAVHLEFSW